MDIIRPRNTKPQPPASLPAPVPAPPAPGGPTKPKKVRYPNDHTSIRSVLSSVGLLLTAFTVAILLNTFVIQSYQVDGQSMQNTLQNDDRLIVNKVPRTLSRLTGRQYVPKRGQIIIFNQSGLPGFVGEKQLIKRVIGLPGEHVVVNNGRITIYNQQHPDGFNPDVTTGYHIDASTTIGNVDINLQKDELFVCGDNRNNSEDSRYFGPIKTSQVVAKLVLRILPLNKSQHFS